MTASMTPSPAPPADEQRDRQGAAHRRTGPRSWWTAAAEWRNWRLPVKVAVLLAVPSVAAVALGAVQIGGDVDQANSLSRIQQLVTLRTALMPLATDLQTERWLTAEKLGTATQISVPDYYALNTRVQQDAATVTSLGNSLLDRTTAAGIRYQGLVGQLAGLGALHQQALNGNADVVTAVSSYGDVIGAVLDLEQALSTQLGEPTLTGPASAMTDLEVAREQVRKQQAVVAVGIARGQLLDTELETVRSSDVLLSDRIADFEVVATPAELAGYQQPDVTNAINNREQLAQAALANGQTLLEVGAAGHNGASLGMTAAPWVAASDAAASQLGDVAGGLATELRNTANTLQDEASNAAGVESVILFAVLLVAAGAGVVIGRHLLRSLAILRGTALEVAEHRLPEVVASIDRGNLSDLSIDPVPVHTHEELGQLARAFDAVHGQAVRSAVGQATLRSNLRNIFINLSRRSQSLVERQLRLMEQLERNEEDPQQLANLFRLDHLATRMRRNNENLMVLSGDDPARRSGHPLPLADVLRAAVSEIEQYQRVVVRSTPSVDVLGYASGDLIRLIAELLDNATSFSPPKTQVRIGGQGFPDGSVRIEIRDEGIGMAAAELAEANGKLTAADTADVPVSRQMGLYVVGRLAKRHSIQVSLEVPEDGGLLAVVGVPAELVKPGSGPVRPPTESVLGATPVNGHANGHNGRSVPLPTVPHEPARPDPDPVGEWASFTGSAIPDVPATQRQQPAGFTWFDQKKAADAGPPSIPTQGRPPLSEPQRSRPAPPPPQPQAGPPQPPARGPQPAQPPDAFTYTSVGLPRRVPRSHAVPSLVPPPAPKRTDAPQTNRPNTSPQAEQTQRNPARARGFLNDYQAGIRQGTHARPEPTTENRQAEAP